MACESGCILTGPVRSINSFSGIASETTLINDIFIIVVNITVKF